MASIQPPCVLLGAFLISVVIACLHSLTASLAAFIPAFCIFILSRPEIKIWSGQLLKANFFILFMWLVVPFTTPGEYIFTLTPYIHISESGIKLCALITLKANAILVVFLSCIAPMSIFKLGTALAQLKCPQKLAWLFILMQSNVAALQREWRRLFESAKLRAFTPRANIYSYGIYGSMIGLLFIRAHERGKSMHEAMLLAGFTGKLPFNSNLTIKKNDVLFLLFIIFCCCFLLYLDYAMF